MLTPKAVRERLDRLIRASRADDYASVSALIGKNHAYIQQFITRGVPARLKEEDRRKVARHFNVPEWELGGPYHELPRKAFQSGFSEGGAAGVVMIPAYDISASAGFGSFVEDELADKVMPFHTGFLRELTATPPEELTLIAVKGDSMTPTLSDGDRILVDTRETKVSRDGIYVIRAGETVSVKRVALNPTTRRLTVKCDNPLYDPWPDCRPDSVKIIGRVIWVGRNL
jgi:Peptidase S24-like